MIILYILGGILAIILLYILFLTVCTLAVSKKKDYKTYNMFYNGVLKGLMFLVLSLCRVRIHVKNIEKIPKDQKLLFICNHRSNFDPMVTWFALNKWKIGYISKASNFKLPFLGKMIRRICFMSIDRDSAGLADGASLERRLIETGRRSMRSEAGQIIFQTSGEADILKSMQRLFEAEI